MKFEHGVNDTILFKDADTTMKEAMIITGQSRAWPLEANEEGTVKKDPQGASFQGAGNFLFLHFDGIYMGTFFILIYSVYTSIAGILRLLLLCFIILNNSFCKWLDHQIIRS